MRKQYLFILFTTLSLIGCNKKTDNDADSVYYTETEFRKAYITGYGQYYLDKGIERQVMMIDLFSDRLDQDSIGKLVGSGTNFGFTDVFVDSYMREVKLPLGETVKRLYIPDGTYTADTTSAAFTFLPGMNFDGLPTGAFLQSVNSGARRDLWLFDSGQFDVVNEGDTTDLTATLNYKNNRGRQLTYQAHYRGVPVILRRQQ